MSIFFFFFSSRRRHTRCSRDWSSDVCSSDLLESVVLHAFVSVRPGAPTDGARDHHEKRGADRVGCKHKSAAPLTLNPFERMACDKNRGTRSRPAPLLPVLIMGTKNGVKQIRRKKAGALLAPARETAKRWREWPWRLPARILI